MYRNLLPYGLILFFLPILIGCGGSQKTASTPTPTFVPNRELSLQHYLEGTLLDQKEDYARAILEYQEALVYDHDPAIYYALAKDYSLLGKHAIAAQMGSE